MGKKPLISSKILLKIETLLIISVSFILLHIFDKKDHSEVEPDYEQKNDKYVSDDVSLNSFGNKQVFFDKEVFAIQKRMIISANRSIKIATYTYSKNELTELLEKRKKEGLNVKMIAGKNKDRSVPQFDFFEFIQKNGIYHPKFMVFDSKDVLITSSNIGSDGSASNSAVLFKDVPQTAKILEEEIDDIFAGILKKRCQTGCETEIGTLFFNPGKGCMAVKNELIKAEKTIKAGIYTVTSRNPVITGLKNALKNGVKVSIIVDNWKGDDGKIVNKKAYSYLISKGAVLKFDELESENKKLFHHKFIVIDNSVTVFGSMNLTSSGCYKNREIVVINKDAAIANIFEKYITEVNSNVTF